MTIDVPDGVYHLQQALQVPIRELSDAAAHYLEDAYKYYVAAVGAVRTGALLQSIHTEDKAGSSGEHHKQVVASVHYAAVVEFGWTERGKGQASYRGRYPAQKAVELLLNSLQDGTIVDALTWRLIK
jgi:hypothetical protein